MVEDSLNDSKDLDCQVFPRHAMQVLKRVQVKAELADYFPMRAQYQQMDLLFSTYMSSLLVGRMQLHT